MTAQPAMSESDRPAFGATARRAPRRRWPLVVLGIAFLLLAVATLMAGSLAWALDELSAQGLRVTIDGRSWSLEQQLHQVPFAAVVGTLLLVALALLLLVPMAVLGALLLVALALLCALGAAALAALVALSPLWLAVLLLWLVLRPRRQAAAG